LLRQADKPIMNNKTCQEQLFRPLEPMPAALPAADLEDSLSLRAAWLAYVGGYTQEQIARRIHVSRVKAQRLVASALQKGLVKFWIEGVPAECMALEEALLARFSLAHCTVVPSIAAAETGGSEIPPLAQAAARMLAHALDNMAGDAAPCIGVGHGRTLAALVECLPRMALAQARFVSLLGSLTRSSAANPWDVVSRLAQRSGGQCFFLPAPLFADSSRDAQVLRAQSGVRQVLQLLDACRLCVIGIGALDAAGHVQRLHSMTAADRQRLLAAGAVGEVCGCFINAQGKIIDDEMHARLIGMALPALRGRQVLAVAGGAYKAQAIAAALRSGVISSLVTDEVAARRVLDDAAHHPDP